MLWDIISNLSIVQLHENQLISVDSHWWYHSMWNGYTVQGNKLTIWISSGLIRTTFDLEIQFQFESQFEVNNHISRDHPASTCCLHLTILRFYDTTTIAGNVVYTLHSSCYLKMLVWSMHQIIFHNLVSNYLLSYYRWAVRILKWFWCLCRWFINANYQSS